MLWVVIWVMMPGLIMPEPLRWVLIYLLIVVMMLGVKRWMMISSDLGDDISKDIGSDLGDDRQGGDDAVCIDTDNSSVPSWADDDVSDEDWVANDQDAETVQEQVDANESRGKDVRDKGKGVPTSDNAENVFWYSDVNSESSIGSVQNNDDEDDLNKKQKLKWFNKKNMESPKLEVVFRIFWKFVKRT